jgi:hypothetical protein
MLKKEFREVLKQLLYFILVMVLLPLLLLIFKIFLDQSYFGNFYIIYHFGLLFLALFMGASLFSGDRGQGGMEYLLSLPYSRLQLIGFKILPRLIAIVIFYLVYLILYQASGGSYSIFFFLFFTTSYISLFLIGVSLSASSDNFLVLSIASLFSLFVYLAFFYLDYITAFLIRGIHIDRLAYEVDPESLILGFIPFAALALVLPFLLAFILSFKKFDVRPAKVYNKRYLKYFTPLIAVGLVISFCLAYLGTSWVYKFYYLTEDHKLIETGYYSKIKIYEKDRVHTVKHKFDSFWPYLEENEYVYDMYGESVVRLNTSDFAIDTLYEAPYEKLATWETWKYDQTIALLEKNNFQPSLQLALLDETSKKIKRITYSHESLKNYYKPVIFGTDQTGGQRFWLIYSSVPMNYPLLRLWDDGRIENIGTTQRAPCYVNQMLITYTEEAMIISQESEGKFESTHKIPEGKDWSFQVDYMRVNLNNFPLKGIYGRIWESREIGRLDLDTFEIKEIAESIGWIDYLYPGDCYFIEMDRPANLIKIHQLKENKLEFLKSFPDFDVREPENRLEVCKGGIVLKKGKKIKVFAFPDLQELKFKKL